MALFGSYAPPGVYTSVVISGGGLPLFGNTRIPVIIGEGQQFFTQNNVELFRGSSAVADDQVVNENISDQATGLTRDFNTTYFPVVLGDGTGTVTNDPTKLQVVADGVPTTVISLDGATGAFALQDIPPLGTNLEVTYYFKRGDTLITNENEAFQIPAFASLVISGAELSPPSGSITISTSLPGASGNLVSVQFIDSTLASPPTAGVVDSLAVGGYGTNTITINIRKVNNTIRTVVDLFNLIESGILTLSAGYLVASAPTGTSQLIAGSAEFLTGGEGPNSNTVFKVEHVPIVDGTNGGVVTTDPSKVAVLVNGSPATVFTVDGASGLITLVSPVAFGSNLTITYYTNTFQNTFDLLPASNVSGIVEVGLGPDRADFIQDTDYVLGTDSNGNPIINWGASTTTVVGISNAADTTPFGPSDINTTLIDERVYLQYCGNGDGRTTLFTLPDVPTDGSGLDNATDNPALITVYVGPDPYTAYQSGAVQVARLSGASAQATLYNPPAAGQRVYANYYRNTLNDHTYTLKVLSVGQTGVGTYSIQNELGFVLPVVANSTNTVADPNFENTGIVYPYAFSDAWDEPNAIDETITFTFNNDGSTTTPGVQATTTIQGVTFTATNTGTASNGTAITFVGGTPDVADASAVQTGSNLVLWQASTAYNIGQIVSDGTNLQVVTTSGTSGATTPTWATSSGTTTDNGVTWTFLGAIPTAQQVLVYIAKPTSLTRTTAQITALFGSISTPATGLLIVSGGNATQAVQAGATMGGGANPTAVPYTHSYTVTSSAGTSGSHGLGYLDQTYIDTTTGFKVTIVNPADALGYGYTQLPSPQYSFAPGDTLTFTTSKETPRYTGSTYFPFGTAEPNNLIAIPGLNTNVITTFGASIGDTAIIATYNKSGNTPTVGEFYYVTFTVAKTAADMAIQLFTNEADAYAAYGQPSVVNRLSLGVSLMIQNGANIFGCIQVPQQPGQNLASDASFIAAIQTLTSALPGQNTKANVIVPLSTSTTVHQFLSRQLITQATARYKGEAIGFVGYSQYTTAAQASANAVSIKNSRIIAVGNPVAGLQLTNSQTGVTLEYALSGEFMAAAMAGLNVNPANDVATTLTLQDLVGFTRLLITYDDATMNLMASNGLVLLLNNNGALQIRHYKSTDPSNPITSEPTCTTIADYVRQQFRIDLQQFIGRKLVDSLLNDITTVCTARLRSLVSNEIIAGYANLAVVPDPTDPTTVDVTVTFQPVFSLLYISMTFTVTTTLSSS